MLHLSETNPYYAQVHARKNGHFKIIMVRFCGIIGSVVAIDCILADYMATGQRCMTC